jgi:hypothetical protein
MTELHDFSAPRNLFEKLIRDYEKLDVQVNGDNIFNFISTAFHLQHWIKNSPLISSEVVKRILRRIARNKCIKHCQAIARAKEHFYVEVGGNEATLIIGEERINLNEFKQEIMNQYANYFQIKG